MVGVIEELKCRAHSLQQQGRALEKLVDGLEAAAEGDIEETGMQMPASTPMFLHSPHIGILSKQPSSIVIICRPLNTKACMPSDVLE